jgi:transcription initiation factor TFIIIB Brf1 subunit/transcription initiation factor TFIIB
MLLRKSCPRCRGDLVMESDFYGQYVSCIQCGSILGERQAQPVAPQRLPRLPKASPEVMQSTIPKSAAAPAG